MFIIMALKMCCRVASQFLQMYLLLAFRFTSDCFNGNLFVFASPRCHLSHQNKHALNYKLDSLLASACSQKKKKWLIGGLPSEQAVCMDWLQIMIPLPPAQLIVSELLSCNSEHGLRLMGCDWKQHWDCKMRNE